MPRVEELESVHIDIEKGIFEVNGRDISKSGSSLELTFKNGNWSLMVTEDTIYNTSDQGARESRR